MPFVPVACGLPCYCHRLRWQRRQGIQQHLGMGLAPLWMPSHTQCREKAGLDSLKNHALNPAQIMAATLQEALDRSVVLSFHCIFAQMICMLCQKNMCAMWYIPASSLRMYIFGNVHGPVYPTLISYINFHVPTSWFFDNLVCFGIGLKHLWRM